VETGASPVHAYEPGADLARLAGAYCFGLVRDRPFNGGKRAGFLALGLFLSLNRYQRRVEQAVAAETILRLAAGQISERALAEWIRKYMVQSH